MADKTPYYLRGGIANIEQYHIGVIAVDMLFDRLILAIWDLAVTQTFEDSVAAFDKVMGYWEAHGKAVMALVRELNVFPVEVHEAVHTSMAGEFKACAKYSLVSPKFFMPSGVAMELIPLILRHAKEYDAQVATALAQRK